MPLFYFDLSAIRQKGIRIIKTRGDCIIPASDLINGYTFSNEEKAMPERDIINETQHKNKYTYTENNAYFLFSKRIRRKKNVDNKKMTINTMVRSHFIFPFETTSLLISTKTYSLKNPSAMIAMAGKKRKMIFLPFI